MARAINRGTAAAAGAVTAALSLVGLGLVVDGGNPPTVSSSPRPTRSAGPPGASTGALVPLPTGRLSGQAPGAQDPGKAPDVLPGLTDSAPAPDPAVLQAQLAPLIGSAALGDSVSLEVVDPLTGTQLAGVDADTARTPASTIKILTAAAALTALGPDATLRTRVVSGSSPDQVVLVGGGDVLLAAGAGRPTAVDGRAGLADLAAATAAALRKQQIRRVSVRVDDTLFVGSPISPAWGSADIAAGFVAPVMALEIHAGRLEDERVSRRAKDPALAAGQAFAAALAREGITVAGSAGRGRAGGSATELASVESAPIADIVELALTESDNTVSEALAKLVAHKTGRPTTFPDAGRAVLAQIEALGLPVGGATMIGGSGLGSGSRISASLLTGVLATAASDRRPALRRLLPGLPVAGASGTLEDRFVSGGLRSAAGVVRAKTGTLRGVHSLAGTVVDADGRLLVFAVLADRAPSVDPAVAVLDRIALTLAGCGCR